MQSVQSRTAVKPFGARPARPVAPARAAIVGRKRAAVAAQAGKHKQEGMSADAVTLFGAAGLLSPLLLDVGSAWAQKGELGIIEGRILSLTHPALEGFLFLSSLYTAWLGFRWRRARTLPDTIKELKAELPKPDAEGNSRGNPELEREIAALEEERKKLTKAKVRDQHWNWGSLILGLGVTISIAGPINTYIRAGKLFPGPHLYVGAAIVACWAVGASLVPAMQKGSETARTAHITLNCINLAPFAWQVPTGLDIVWKVIQFTSLP